MKKLVRQFCIAKILAMFPEKNEAIIETNVLHCKKKYQFSEQSIHKLHKITKAIRLIFIVYIIIIIIISIFKKILIKKIVLQIKCQKKIQTKQNKICSLTCDISLCKCPNLLFQSFHSVKYNEFYSILLNFYLYFWFSFNFSHS